MFLQLVVLFSFIFFLIHKAQNEHIHTKQDLRGYLFAWQTHEGFSQGGQSDHRCPDRKLLDVDIHPDFGTAVERRAFLSAWCKTFYAHKGEGSLLPERPQDLSCAKSPRRTISGHVCGDLSSKRSKINRIRVSVRVKILRKITSASAESCIQFLWLVMLVSTTPLTWIVSTWHITYLVFSTFLDQVQYLFSSSFSLLHPDTDLSCTLDHSSNGLTLD